MSEEDDLTVANYDLDELLNLFNLKPDFSEKELKSAKAIVLKLHPDKSRLDKKYFLFYSEAYKLICNLWTFRSKSESNNKAEDTVYIADTGDEEVEGRKKLLNNMFSKNESLRNAGEFNKWFNSEFEKAKVDFSDEGRGYGDWLKDESNENANSSERGQITLSQMKDEFMEKKRQAKQDMIVYNEISSYDVTSQNAGWSSIADTPNVFDGGSGSLVYQDLQKAHTETIIPVDESDLDSIRTFKSVDEMQNYRHTQNLIIDPEEQEKTLRMQTREDSENATRRAYKLAKQSEEVSAKSQMFWKNLRLLGDK